MRNIVLIGMRGCGKTTIAKLLGEKLNKKHLDTDDLIVEKVSQKIPDIVREHGIEHFRDLESQAIKTLADHKGMIIATGGGFVMRPVNAEHIKHNSLFVWLKASHTDLVGRTENDPNRPPLTNLGDMGKETREILQIRNPLYHELAHIEIDTESKNEEEVVQEIIGYLDKLG